MKQENSTASQSQKQSFNSSFIWVGVIILLFACHMFDNCNNYRRYQTLLDQYYHLKDSVAQSNMHPTLPEDQMFSQYSEGESWKK